MNRFEGKVVDDTRGSVAFDGALLPADVARSRPQGERVLLLIRPETIELAPLADGAAPPNGALEGKVRAHTFLGPVTRLNVDSSIGDVVVDIASSQALSLAQDTRVALTWDPSTPRIISLASQDQTVVDEPEQVLS
jgi:ABC-type Fe3+/spermidine/putrescine transport system ATPase subunit